MSLFLEVIASSLEDVIAINKTGASRIEFCIDLNKGGLSADPELIAKVVEQSEIPINVMVRFSESHYLTDELVNKMISFIDVVKHFGLNGFVLGGLTKDDLIDSENMKKLLVAANGFETTFHNCFNQIKDKVAALDELSKLGFNNVLTSGTGPDSFKNIEELSKLHNPTSIEYTNVLIGGGLNKANILEFAKRSLSPLHIGTAARTGNKFENQIDPKAIDEIIEIWNSVN